MIPCRVWRRILYGLSRRSQWLRSPFGELGTLNTCTWSPDPSASRQSRPTASFPGFLPRPRQVRCPIAVPSQGCSNAACRAPVVVAGLSAELGGPNLQRPTHMLRLQLSDRGDSKALADGVAKSLGPLNRIASRRYRPWHGAAQQLVDPNHRFPPMYAPEIWGRP